MRSALLVLAGVLLLMSVAKAGPLRAQSADECRAFADVGVTARALVEHQVGEETRMAILNSMYLPSTARGKQVLAEVERSARDANKPANEWARALLAHCMAKGGAMEGFLGVKL